MSGTDVTAGRTSALPHLQDVYRACFFAEDGDMAGRRAAQERLNNSTAIYHGEVIGLGFLPKLYDMPTLAYLDSLAQTTYGILEKVTQRFCEDSAYRSLFGFSPLLERLISLPAGYETTIPIMRVDIFLDEESLDFKFCEFNTDGTSAMNEDREGANALMCSTTFAHAAQELALAPQELFEGWVDAFLALWESSEQAAGHPKGEPVTIAIVDYTESATSYEFEEFRARFERRGYPCLICDVRGLTWQNGALYGSDVNPAHPASGTPTRIDAVYRRAVTGELLAELEADATFGAHGGAFDDASGAAAAAPAESTAPEGGTSTLVSTPIFASAFARGAHALVAAVEARRVCMIGGFRTHVAHCKQLFTVLHLPETASFLTEEEAAFIRHHVPYTTRLDNQHIDLDAVKADKNRWIIKPDDGYGSQGVFAGIDQGQGEWEEIIDRCSAERYIVQRFCEQYATPNTRLLPANERGADKHGDGQAADTRGQASANPSFDPTTLEPFNVLTGLYLYDGRFSGVFVRAGQQGIIAGFAGGITVPSFLAGYRPEAGLALRCAPLPPSLR
ncbi:MAG: hypothetical protein LBP24_05505 [Coriobacteriales bacterium]|jgi:hypothetical protein|nr:hypothetical protein [Coriobacteriales bacterium]